ncbi:MAG: transcription termination/antitermination factor NusG [Lentisphaerae bacterium]|nr:transcription termination/antitermination factor NusG [Lentisphaerota bacterium]
MRLGWFVLQTLTGQEQKVQRLLEAKSKELGLDASIGEVLMPTERVTSVKMGKKTTVVKKLFPGYLFIQAAVYEDDGKKRNEPVWSFIKGIQGVIGFLGGEPPREMRAAEVDAICGQVAGVEEKPKPKVDFEPGELVRITDGPFMNSSGVVQSIDHDHGRLTVMVTIFGGETPVDLEYWQVEREVPAAPAPHAAK